MSESTTAPLQLRHTQILLKKLNLVLRMKKSQRIFFKIILHTSCFKDVKSSILQHVCTMSPSLVPHNASNAEKKHWKSLMWFDQCQILTVNTTRLTIVTYTRSGASLLTRCELNTLENVCVWTCMVLHKLRLLWAKSAEMRWVECGPHFHIPLWHEASGQEKDLANSSDTTANRKRSSSTATNITLNIYK